MTSCLRTYCSGLRCSLWLSLLIMFLLIISANSQTPAGKSEWRIKYVSADHVYLDGGRLSGLAVGDTLAVRSDSLRLARLAVVFIADYSASCKILEQTTSLNPGDVVIRISPARPKETAAAAEDTLQTQKPPQAPQKRQPVRKPVKKRDVTRLSGSVSAQGYFLIDDSDAGLDFLQPTLRVRLRVRNLWDKGYELRLRTRSRYNQRSRSYSNDVPESEWRNRLYEASFVMNQGERRFNFALGRIIPTALSGVGYLDGMQLQLNMTRKFSAGVLGGTRPDLRTSGFSSNIRKFGGYLKLEGGSPAALWSQATLGLSGEYNGNTVSREFLAWNSRISSDRWAIFHSAEVDVNRDWRKEKAGSSTSWSGGYLSGRYTIRRSLTLGIIADTRKNYWTYEIRSLADSLFDDALRRGLRFYVNLRGLSNTHLNINIGQRKRDGDSRGTSSLSLSLRKQGLLFRTLGMDLNASGFSGPNISGDNYYGGLSLNFRGGQSLRFGSGQYNYRLKDIDLLQENNWLRLEIFWPASRFYLNGSAEMSRGDNLAGSRSLLEIGYRL